MRLFMRISGDKKMTLASVKYFYLSETNENLNTQKTPL